MLQFFTDCAGLFNHIFQAACQLEFFRFLAALLMLLGGLAVFLLLFHGSKRL